MRAIVSINGYPCKNPETHEYGSLPCCEGIIIDEDQVDISRCIVVPDEIKTSMSLS